MDNTAKKIEDLLNSLGAMAEMSLTYYRALISNGATEDEAVNITKAFMDSCFGLCGDENKSNG